MSSPNRASGDEFQAWRLVTSLLIGFVAGSLAVLVSGSGDADWTPSKQEMCTLLGAGYAGTDFIEGIITRYVPRGGDKPDPAFEAKAEVAPAAGGEPDRDVPAVG